MQIGFIGAAGHWGYAKNQVNNHQVRWQELPPVIPERTWTG